MRLDRARARAVDAGYAAGWGLVKSAPNRLARGSFRTAAHYATVRNGHGAQQLRKNLRRVVGPDLPESELDGLVGEALRSYARYWLETFRLPKMDKRAIVERLDAEGLGHDNLEAGLARGKGVIVALPHQGNWDVSGVWTVAKHGPFTTVAERLEPESLFDRFVAYREGLGFEVLPLTGGERAPLTVLKQRLAQNKIVCLVADRDLSQHGVEVEFFGETTRMPGGPALLAATTGAALCPVNTWFTADGWGHQIHPALPLPEGRLRDQVPALTQAMAHAFEPGIAAHPADWHMLQRLWLADLAPRGDRAA